MLSTNQASRSLFVLQVLLGCTERCPRVCLARVDGTGGRDRILWKQGENRVVHKEMPRICSSTWSTRSSVILSIRISKHFTDVEHLIQGAKAVSSLVQLALRFRELTRIGKCCIQAGGPRLAISVCTISTEGAPSLRFLQGWAAMRHALFDLFYGTRPYAHAFLCTARNSHPGY